MSKRNEGWGCLLSIIVASVLFVFIIPKSNNTDTSGTNKNNYWYKKRMEYEKTKQNLKEIKQRQVELQNSAKQYQSTPIPMHKNSSLNTPGDAYSEGYDEGFEHGNYDGRHGYSHGHSYDDSSSYNGNDENRYQDGYSNGYDEGYGSGKSDYDEEHEDEFDD